AAEHGGRHMGGVLGARGRRGAGVGKTRTGEPRHCGGNAPCKPIERRGHGSPLFGGKTADEGQERNGCTTVDEECHPQREVRGIDCRLIDLTGERVRPVMRALGNLSVLLMQQLLLLFRWRRWWRLVRHTRVLPIGLTLSHERSCGAKWCPAGDGTVEGTKRGMGAWHKPSS